MNLSKLELTILGAMLFGVACVILGLIIVVIHYMWGVVTR